VKTNKLKKSIKIDLTSFSGKKFKILCEIVRSGVKQEHGYRATKGLTDERLLSWPIIIRFDSNKNRENYLMGIKGIVNSTIIKKMGCNKLKPIGKAPKAIKFFES